MEESDLGEIINTSWHYSWHWDRDEYGNLTEKGKRQALENASDEYKSCLDRLAKLSETVAFLAHAVDEIDNQKKLERMWQAEDDYKAKKRIFFDNFRYAFGKS